MASINRVRVVFYVALLLFAIILLGLTAQRLNYTTHLPVGDPLNGGRSFHDPIIAELLVTSILTILWAPFAIYILSGTSDYGLYTSFLGEATALFFLFMFYVVGAGIASVRHITFHALISIS
ncbi:hypothetical protein NLI96_g7036 [Meripilus lineatus]|uniref:Uncharacterized protein n=1 Tax=Meripilus lineatus TaxID=2056292 RepID=A0AAD5UZR6_9APHY|nr:hypothetical protein NLI96_g7036 [Physisporinus lineatus]